ncbi:hypothetical protein N7488_012323, partial [Penicillium malachiteum]
SRRHRPLHKLRLEDYLFPKREWLQIRIPTGRGRLLSKLDIQLSGRINTLPDTSIVTADAMPLKAMQTRNLPPSKFHSSERQSKSQEETIAFQETSANNNTSMNI